MKILHVVWKNRIGGAELFAYRLAERQSKKNNVSLIYLSENQKKYQNSNGLCICDAGLKSGFDLLGYLRFCKKLTAENYDIIHVHQNLPSVLFAKLFSKCSIIVKHEHGTSRSGWKSHREIILSKFLTKYFIDIYVANSNYTKQQLQKHEKIDNKNIKVIPCGIDVEKFEKGLRNKVKEELGINSSSKVIGFAGRLHLQKGIEDFIAAAECILQEEPNVCFLIAGDGSLRQSVEKQIQKSIIFDKTILMGFRNDMPDVMKSMDILLITSRWEPQGLVAVEAMASGLPIVAFAVDGVPEVVKNSGILIQDRSVKLMAEKTLELIRNQDQAQKIILLGKKVAQNYKMQTINSKIMELYFKKLSN